MFTIAFFVFLGKAFQFKENIIIIYSFTFSVIRTYKHNFIRNLKDTNFWLLSIWYLIFVLKTILLLRYHLQRFKFPQNIITVYQYFTYKYELKVKLKLTKLVLRYNKLLSLPHWKRERISKRRRAFRQAYNLRFLKRCDASFLRDPDIFLLYFKIKNLK